MPQRGSASASAAGRPYFLNGRFPPVVGARDNRARPRLFLASSFLCEELHIRGSRPGIMFHRSSLWVEGNHAVGGGE